MFKTDHPFLAVHYNLCRVKINVSHINFCSAGIIISLYFLLKKNALKDGDFVADKQFDC